MSSGPKSRAPSGRAKLVVYDWPGVVGLLEYYEKGDYLPDND